MLLRLVTETLAQNTITSTLNGPTANVVVGISGNSSTTSVGGVYSTQVLGGVNGFLSLGIGLTPITVDLTAGVSSTTSLGTITAGISQPLVEVDTTVYVGSLPSWEGEAALTGVQTAGFEGTMGMWNLRIDNVVSGVPTVTTGYGGPTGVKLVGKNPTVKIY